MRCPFCDGSLSSREVTSQVDTMETGGLWRRTEHECASCGGAIVHDVVFKVGQARESWELERVPARLSPRGSLFCPACDQVLVSAWPPDAQPEPATGVGSLPSINVRETEHVCARCGARYQLRESVDSTWYSADGARIEPPRPFRRSR